MQKGEFAGVAMYPAYLRESTNEIVQSTYAVCTEKGPRLAVRTIASGKGPGMMNKISQTLIVSASIVSVCAASSLAAVTKPSSPSPTLRVTPAPKQKDRPRLKQRRRHRRSPRLIGRDAAVAISWTHRPRGPEAKTFSVGKEKARVFKVTTEPCFRKLGRRDHEDAVVNENPRSIGNGRRHSRAKTVKLGPKTDAEKAADEKSESEKEGKGKRDRDERYAVGVAVRFDFAEAVASVAVACGRRRPETVHTDSSRPQGDGYRGRLSRGLRRNAKVREEKFVLALARFFVGLTQQR